MKCGAVKLMEYVDMSCGAIPEGPYEKVIDASASKQFLSMYVQVVESRFAMAVTQVLKLNPNIMTGLKDFCFQVGKNNRAENLDGLQSAFDFIASVVLDAMPDENKKEIFCNEEKKLCWKSAFDSHKKYWDKVQGDIKVYYELQMSFVNGLLADSGIKYLVEENGVFTLIKS